jgi:putative endonuclease
MPYYVYILASRRYGTLYIGVTNSVGNRLRQHKLGYGSEFVRKYGVNRLVYSSREATEEMEKGLENSAYRKRQSRVA